MTSLKKKFEEQKLLFFLAALVLILLIIFVSFKSVSKKRVSLVIKPDLRSHPIYSKYRFNNNDRVVNIGTQPLYLPTGLISEAIKHDKILNTDLLNSGLEVKYYPFLKGDDVNFFLKNNALDAGIGGDMPAITGAATMELSIPLLIQQGFISIIARRPMLIRDLRGKRIGYAFGSNAHYALLNALSSENISESEVELIPMDTHEMADALSAEKIDAFSAWEPTPAITLKKHPDFVVIHQRLTTGYMYFQKAFFDKNSEASLHILSAVLRSLRWMKRERKNLLQACMWSKRAGEELSGQSIPLSVQEIAELAEKDILGLINVPAISTDNLREKGLLNKEFDFLRSMRKIPASSKWKKVRDSFDRKAIEKVMYEKKKYKLYRFDYMLEVSK